MLSVLFLKTSSGDDMCGQIEGVWLCLLRMSLVFPVFSRFTYVSCQMSASTPLFLTQY
jgi:hypothetical protein